mmetsp:Transcript_35690/g.104451  ORF Transcript_35690/g.104451 Transcript_35690/m.104451 type:complete len:211 (+) Transcript_35690:1213-1845(+)
MSASSPSTRRSMTRIARRPTPTAPTSPTSIRCRTSSRTHRVRARPSTTPYLAATCDTRPLAASSTRTCGLRRRQRAPSTFSTAGQTTAGRRWTRRRCANGTRSFSRVRKSRASSAPSPTCMSTLRSSRRCAISRSSTAISFPTRCTTSSRRRSSRRRRHRPRKARPRPRPAGRRCSSAARHSQSRTGCGARRAVRPSTPSSSPSWRLRPR